jgi:hypothetical protein
MSTFRDALLRELQSRVAEPTPVPRRNRPRRRLVLASTGLAAVAAIAAVVLGQLSAGTPAYAVTANPDGTVSVRVERVSDVRSANQALRDHGFGTVALAVPSNLSAECIAQGSQTAARAADPSNASRGLYTKVDPAKLPDGMVLVLVTVEVPGQSDRLTFTQLTFPADSPCLRDIAPLRAAVMSNPPVATQTGPVPTASENPGCGLVASCPPVITAPAASADPGCGLATYCPPDPTIPPASRQPTS